MKVNWEETLRERLRLYGHRNWLVITDAAYPAQSAKGIETIVADGEPPTILQRVFKILATCSHIAPKIFMDEELGFVREEDAPGIDLYREKLRSLVNAYKGAVLPHEEMITRLDRVGGKFRVLLIKTNMRLPYTSVFLELECGYWDSESEKRLRASMRSRNRRRSPSRGFVNC